MSKRKPENSGDLRSFFGKKPTDAITSDCEGLEHSNGNVAEAKTETVIIPCSQPCHIRDVSILPKHISAGRSRSFNVEWYSQFPWLHWQEGKLLCHTCVAANSQKGMTLSKRVEDALCQRGCHKTGRKLLRCFAITFIVLPIRKLSKR
jgi:hypothetical protein